MREAVWPQACIRHASTLGNLAVEPEERTSTEAVAPSAALAIEVRSWDCGFPWGQAVSSSSVCSQDIHVIIGLLGGKGGGGKGKPGEKGLRPGRETQLAGEWGDMEERRLAGEPEEVLQADGGMGKSGESGGTPHLPPTAAAATVSCPAFSDAHLVLGPAPGASPALTVCPHHGPVRRGSLPAFLFSR